MEYIETGANHPSPHDIEAAKAGKQWFHNGSTLTISAAQAAKDPRIFYLTKATGTGITLAVNDKAGVAKTVSGAVSELDFTAAPFCLGRYGFAFGGTVNMITGFYV